MDGPSRYCLLDQFRHFFKCVGDAVYNQRVLLPYVRRMPPNVQAGVVKEIYHRSSPEMNPHAQQYGEYENEAGRSLEYGVETAALQGAHPAPQFEGERQREPGEKHPRRSMIEQK